MSSLTLDRPRPPVVRPGARVPHAIVIGSGFGGLAAAIRLGARGYRVTVLEKLDQPGGRGSVFRQDGFTFDAGPTIVTLPQLFEELWALAGRKFSDDITLKQLDPLYQIRFDDGSLATVHLANSGSMLGTSEPGSRVWLSRSDSPTRKLAWSWEPVEIDGALVGVNTAHPNRIAAEATAAGTIPELAGYDTIRREVRYGSRNSRVDLLLESPGRPPCFVEIKNVHLKRGDWAEFPDAVTARGAKHLAELADEVAKGARAVMLYLVQRQDCRAFRPAADIDPTYAAGLSKAKGDGVEAICYTCRMGLDGIEVGHPLPLHLEPTSQTS